MEWSAIIAAGSLAFVILSAAGSVIWKVGRIEISVRAESQAKIDAQELKHQAEVTALHAKVYQVEIWARDEFVRKGSFETVVARLEKGMETLGTKIEGAVDKMSIKIDRITHEQ